MIGVDAVQVVALVGWLALMLGVYASYRLNWKETVRLVLIWACIFAGVTFIIGMMTG